MDEKNGYIEEVRVGYSSGTLKRARSRRSDGVKKLHRKFRFYHNYYSSNFATLFYIACLSCIKSTFNSAIVFEMTFPLIVLSLQKIRFVFRKRTYTF